MTPKPLYFGENFVILSEERYDYLEGYRIRLVWRHDAFPPLYEWQQPGRDGWVHRNEFGIVGCHEEAAAENLYRCADHFMVRFRDFDILIL